VPDDPGPSSASGGDRAITVLVADDHPVVRQGMTTYLSTVTDVEVVGEASDGRDVVERHLALAPDVTLIDLRMPRLGGIAAIRLIREHDPDAKLVVLTSFSDDAEVMAALQAGAVGYLLKDADPAEVVEAIRSVHRGGAALAPSVASTVVHSLRAGATPQGAVDLLTPRELDVVRAVGRGLTNRQVAAELYISEKTVKTHMTSILMKLGLTDRTQVALWAVREGVVDPTEVG